MQGRLLLDVVVRKGPAVFELLASKNEALLVRGNAFLVLDLALDIIDCVAGLDLKSDCRRMLETVTTSQDAFIGRGIFRLVGCEYILVLPVRVLTKICMPPLRRRTR